jgi:hypothetical protein
MKNIQATGNLYGKTVTVKQISKAAAKKLFAQGNEVYLQSSNMYPFGVWQSLCPVKLDSEQLQADIKHNEFCITLYSEQVQQCNNVNDEEWRKDMLADYQQKVDSHKAKVINEGTQFESTVNNYSYYNCDRERGKYVNFYTVL